MTRKLFLATVVAWCITVSLFVFAGLSGMSLLEYASACAMIATIILAWATAIRAVLYKGE